ncbi:MAG: 39S ribosomal protein L45 [Pseudodesulfovibrio sp.]|uniref:Import inner membrane translocase subunit Tim44 n=1 Tax=Pseudodesulfovibrio aespoeensis (strain ATCC 700646 / DSM 10631 / Aspo-2) TaxID=643562 RepID=E6VVB8_PSEA9|nr:MULTISPECIES: Tim44-like domain-containing protein [Pseudodesulfovibrio]MBU4193223.1 39S ribosomal protein L45 [Pseudomonadota bacterium]ADU62362.1 import inner membrane translocase subunit Tim44 [Pseudodesulfovibrio aespoeensis Aspo-2]MBU4377696.1 39S ribosomal protein L45 [Pseudomonadota bacterium]MBU4473974.1 39S ribosomal protein L45 [Pseudomonadota bacterium]MBU4515172.1 39S ribosomal protein L45 [Pseudomonadota bacterium]
MKSKINAFAISVRLAGMACACALAVLLVSTAALASAEAPQSRSGSLLNILLLGLVAYFLVRAFRRRGGGPGPGTGSGSGDSGQDDGGQDDQAQPPARPTDRHEAARQMWNMLGSKDAPEGGAPQAVRQSPAPVPGGFDEAEFLEGAKLFFSRFQQVSGQGDLDQLRGFLSDDVYEQALAGLAAQQTIARTEVMLVDARLMERKSEGGRTWITVFYDAQLRKGVSGDQPYQLRAAWEFSRTDAEGSGLWTLESINKRDQ